MVLYLVGESQIEMEKENDFTDDAI